MGNRFCIRAPDTFSYRGTDYTLIKPNLSPKVTPNPLLDQYEYQVAEVYCLGNSGQPQNECGSNQENYDRVEDDEFDFEYLPVAQPPVITKTVLQGEGTPLLPANHPNCQANRDNPGCFVSYSMTIDNIRDGNFFGTHIEDQIPLNLKQDGNNVVIDSVVLSNSASGDKPAGWSTDTVVADPATCAISAYIPQVFNYGYAREFQTQYSCVVFPTNGSVPNSIRVHFDVMPAYSSLTINWHGYTKDAQNIGVYPSGPPYCATAVSPAQGAYSADGPILQCEDMSAGLQGVSNFATAIVDGWLGNAVPSNVTYNPIPGEIIDVTKSVMTEAEFESGISDADENGIPEFDTDDPLYDEADYTINVTPNVAKGPITYQVIDQNNGGQDFNVSALHSGMDVDTTSCSGTTPPLACANSGLRWDFLSWPLYFNDGTYTFHVQYRPGTPLGGRVTNQAKVCWLKMWEVGHNPACLPSNPVEVERGLINKPYFGVQKGGVRAGGNFLTAPEGICLTTEHGGFNANAGSYGQYVVSAAGNVANVNSLIGIKNQGGHQCRPDVQAEVDKYIDRGPTYHDTMPGNDIVNSNSGGVNVNNLGYPAGGPARVIEPFNKFGDVSIENLTVNRRWTLYVHGDLYIRGNIQNDPSPALISGQPSLGIVVEGNVYIENDVNTIDALIYAVGTSTGKGKINTCSLGDGRSLQNPKTNGYNTQDCKQSRLKVNGALMGKAIQFTRTHQRVSGTASEAEIVELIGQAYVLPPPGFTNLLNSASGGVVREKQPRF